MDLLVIYNLCAELINKAQAGNFPPGRFTLFFNQASRELFNEYLPSRRKDSPYYSYEENMKVTEDIKPFKVAPIPLQIDSDGRANYPEDLAYLSSFSKMITIKNSCNSKNAKTREVPIRILDDDKVGQVVGSQVVGPTIKHPVSTCYADYVQFWPKSLGVATIAYLKKPREVSFAYTQVNNRPVYDQANSVQTDWPDQVIDKLIIRICEKQGLNLREAEVLQYTQQKIAEGK